MSVFVKITTPGGAVYRVSDGPTEHSGFAWRPILKNTVPIERAARATENGIPTTAQTLNIWNAERYIGVVDALLNDALTDSTVEIEVLEIQGSWNGIIKAWEQGSNGLLSIRAGQDTLAVFKRQVPDETIRLVTFTGASREAVNTTIPTVIGGTTSDPVPVPGILIDRVGFTWAFCVGKCRSIVRVMRDRKVITTGFTTYLGAADQAIWPGMVCVKFAADPRDSNGAWPEITAELVGLEIGSTEAEGRNPARVIRAYLTTADTGACGWGLGEPADSIDTASFDQASLDCDTLGLHLDGMMSQAALSSYWLSQMCLGGRLRLDKPAGKWRLRVDVATDSVKEYDADNILSYSFWPGDSSLRHKKARVEYRADFITKQFLGSATRTIGTIGEEENLLEQHLVRDHTTGNAIADYVANIEKFGELRMQIQTPEVAVGTRTLEEDEVVTIRVPEFPNGRLFRVTSLSQGTDESRVELRSYDDAIFNTTTPESTTDPSLDPIVRAAPLPAPPMDPSGLNLVTDSRIQADGTLLVWIDGTYTPGTGFLIARIEYGEGATPATWTELGSTTNGNWHHEPVKPGQLYTYRVTAINTGGSSSSATASIQAANDTTAPGTPQTPLLKALFKSITVECLQNLSKAADLAGFEVWRNTVNNSGTATKTGFQPCPGTADSATYLDETTDYGATYYYWTKAKDHTGNTSGFSAVAGPITTQGIIAGDLAAGALNSSALFAAGVVDAAAIAECAVTAAKTNIAAISRTTGNLNTGVVGTAQLVDSAITNAKISAGAIALPGGAIASYSALGSTTAEIVVAGGVKDVSGHSLHGTAYGNTAVVDTSVGKGFSFDGTGDYIMATGVAKCSSFAFSLWASIDPTMANGGMIGFGAGSGTEAYNLYYWGSCSGKFFGFNSFNSDSFGICGADAILADGKMHHIVGNFCVGDYTKFELYIDGTKQTVSQVLGTSINRLASTTIGIGSPGAYCASQTFKGCISRPKVYGRFLTETEVKTLYQFPDDVVFGNITADLIAANSVTASKICSGSVCACHLGVCAVTADAIAAGAIVAGKLAANSVYGCNIIAGTICSAQIGACQIAACNLAAGIITSEKIISTGITGACICAGTITASHLLIAAPGAALNADPGFLDTSAWGSMDLYESCGNFSIATVTDGKVGSGVLRGSGSSGSSYDGFVGCHYIPIDPTKTYRLSAWIRARGTTNGSVYLSVREYNNAKTALSSNLGTYVISAVTPGTGWTRYSGYIGPSGGMGLTVYFNAATAWARVGGIMDYATTTGLGYEVQDLRLEEVLPATLIQDGAITTSKIIATGISGACICAGSITTAHLSASGICADCVKAGTLSGVTVCANTGLIGGWTVNTGYLSYDCPCVAVMYLYPACYGYQLGLKNASNSYCGWIAHGKMLWGTNYQNAVGFSASCGSGTTYGVLTFAAGHALTGGITLPDSTTVSAGCAFVWIGDSDSYVKYNAGTLSVKGSISITDGSMSGMTIASTYICKATTTGLFYINATYGSLFTQSLCCNLPSATLGQYYWCGTYKNGYGLSVTNNYRCPPVVLAGTAIAAITLPDTTSVSAGCSHFWVGDSSAYMKYYGGVLTVLGTVCATAGYISNFCITTDGLNSYTCCNASYVSMRTVASGYSGYSLGYIFVGGNLGKTNCFGYGSSCVAIQGGLNGCDYFNAPLQVLLGCGSACVAFYSNGCIRVSSVCCSSDRNLKYNISAVEVLPRIRSLAISEWSFKGELVRHVGPMAQDFYEIFKGYSSDPKAIGGLDGIALKGVQELDGCVNSLKTCIRSLEERLCNLETRLIAA